ncbi:hypothetical protein [Alistipes finegoldii]|jgi:hypothetical protein|uniref:hypothetical protein n=1 Tax=Alistipes finegoldii TaxID=214856 RepID=UPI0025A3D711|nr:hypothetical protein [Alistipes finegoldii]
MKKYGTAQTFGSFSANCDGRQLRFQPGNIRKRTGYLKLRRTTGIGRDNKSRPGTTGNRPGTTGNWPGTTGNWPGTTGNRPGTTGNRPGTTGNRPGTAGTAPEYPKPMRTQVPATEKAAGTIECP